MGPLGRACTGGNELKGVRSLIGIGLLWTLVMGCYKLVPVTGNPLPVGSQLSLVINDAGRAALGGSMGPEIAQIEGRLVQKDSSEFQVAVSMVHLIRGGDQAWSGEKIRVRTEFVVAVQERRFSKSRTAIISAAVVGALLLVARQSLLGAGREGDTTIPPDSSDKIRIIRP